MRNIIIDLQNFDTWKIQLTIVINLSSKDAEEEHLRNLNSNNLKFTSFNDANEVVNELFESLSSKYQDNLETSMKGSDFIFESVQQMYYKCQLMYYK